MTVAVTVKGVATRPAVAMVAAALSKGVVRAGATDQKVVVPLVTSRVAAKAVGAGAGALKTASHAIAPAKEHRKDQKAKRKQRAILLTSVMSRQRGVRRTRVLGVAVKVVAKAEAAGQAQAVGRAQVVARVKAGRRCEATMMGVHPAQIRAQGQRVMAIIAAGAVRATMDGAVAAKRIAAARAMTVAAVAHRKMVDATTARATTVRATTAAMAGNVSSLRGSVWAAL